MRKTESVFNDQYPLISIITVCFNAEDHIEETILSVINQTYKKIEYIIIDGGSTDRTIDIIKKYKNKIAHFISEPDSGIFDAMNKGILIANGSFLSFLNNGDKYLNNDVLSQICSFMNDKSTVYCFGYSDVFNYGKAMYARNRLPKKTTYDMPTCHNSMFFPNDKSILYKLEYKVCSEFNYFLEYVRNGYHYKLNNSYVVSRLRGGFSDQRIFGNIRDRLLTNVRHNKALFPVFMFFYIKEFIVQAIKKIVPMHILNSIRNFYGLPYTKI